MSDGTANYVTIDYFMQSLYTVWIYKKQRRNRQICQILQVFSFMIPFLFFLLEIFSLDPSTNHFYDFFMQHLLQPRLPYICANSKQFWNCSASKSSMNFLTVFRLLLMRSLIHKALGVNFFLKFTDDAFSKFGVLSHRY